VLLLVSSVKNTHLKWEDMVSRVVTYNFLVIHEMDNLCEYL